LVEHLFACIFKQVFRLGKSTSIPTNQKNSLIEWLRAIIFFFTFWTQ